MKHLILEGVDTCGKSTLIDEVFPRFNPQQAEKISIFRIDFFELAKRYKKKDIRQHVQSIYISELHEYEKFYIFDRSIISNTIFSKHDLNCPIIAKRQFYSDLRMLQNRAIILFIHISARTLKKRLKHHPENQSFKFMNQIRKDYLKLYRKMHKENPEDVLLLRNNTLRQKKINIDLIAILAAIQIGI